MWYHTTFKEVESCFPFSLLKIVCGLQVAYLTKFMREIARAWPVFKSIVFAQYERARQLWGEGHVLSKFLDLLPLNF